MNSHLAPYRGFATVTKGCALLLVLFGFAGLINFVSGQYPHALLPESLGASPYAIVCYFALALSLWQLQKEKANFLTRFAGAVVVAIQLKNFIEFGLVATRAIPIADLLHKTALPSSVSLFFLGVALFIVDHKNPRVQWALHLLVAITLSVSLTSLIGYTYGFESLTTFGFAAPFRLENAFLILLASVGLICARPDKGLFRIITSETTAGKMSRIMLPTVMILPFLGWVSGIGSNTDADLLLILNLVLYGLPILILVSANTLDTAERERNQAYSRLSDLNKKLQEQLIELNRSEQTLRESLDTRKQLIANINHELRTPLHSVLGIVHLLSGRPRDAAEQNLVISLKDAAEQLLSLVSRMLTFSDLRERTLTMDLSDFDPREITDGCVRALAHLGNLKQIDLNVEYEETLPRSVQADQSLFESVVKSVIENAVQFTQNGHVSVALSSAVHDQKNCLRIMVEDSGIGMTQQQLSRVLKPFEKVDNSYSRRQGGLGLGLALVREIIALVDGEFLIRSQPGEGTTVEIYFPVELHEDIEKTSEQMTFQGPRSVLIAEDSVVNGIVLKKLLQQLGISADVVSNGKLALGSAQTGRYGLILMDVQMPEMDGLEATRQIRQLAHPASRIPIIAVTAHVTDTDKRDCLDAGMNDFITKPVRMELLKEVINRWLEQAPHKHTHDVA